MNNTDKGRNEMKYLTILHLFSSSYDFLWFTVVGLNDTLGGSISKILFV